MSPAHRVMFGSVGSELLMEQPWLILSRRHQKGERKASYTLLARGRETGTSGWEQFFRRPKAFWEGSSPAMICLIMAAFSYPPLGSLMSISSFMDPGRLHSSAVLIYGARLYWEVCLVGQERQVFISEKFSFVCLNLTI